ncbi:unnamed protein product, partial [Mesorhabditis spiculigera]
MFYSGVSKLYDGICLLYWGCVVDLVDVYYAGIGLNILKTSLHRGFFYAQQFLLHALTIDRGILAFLGHRVHRFARYFTVVYGIVMMALPMIPIGMMTGIIYTIGPLTGNEVHCWGGYYFDPGNMQTKRIFLRDRYAAVLMIQVSTWSLGIMTLTMVLNLATFWRFKLLLGFANLAYFCDELLLALTNDDKLSGSHWIKREDVGRNVAKMYSLHIGAVFTGILFVAYGLSCPNKNTGKTQQTIELNRASSS